MKVDVKTYINDVVDDVNCLGDKVGNKSSIYKIAKMKLTKKFKLESSELNEALIYMEQEIAKCGLLKVSRSTYADKELFKCEFLEFLRFSQACFYQLALL